MRTCSRVEEGTHSTTMERQMGRVEDSEETEAKARGRRRKRRHERAERRAARTTAVVVGMTHARDCREQWRV